MFKGKERIMFCLFFFSNFISKVFYLFNECSHFIGIYTAFVSMIVFNVYIILKQVQGYFLEDQEFSWVFLVSFDEF